MELYELKEDEMVFGVMPTDKFAIVADAAVRLVLSKSDSFKLEDERLLFEEAVLFLRDQFAYASQVEIRQVEKR